MFSDLFSKALRLLCGDVPAAQHRPFRRSPERYDGIRGVRQQHRTGCGIAMVAMVASVPYPEARRVLFGMKRRRHFYTDYVDIRRALDHYGLKYTRRARRFVSWACLDGPAVVAVRNLDGSLHWVLFNRSGRRRYVLDPDPPEGRTLSRTDFSSLKGVSYLLLDPASFQGLSPSG